MANTNTNTNTLYQYSTISALLSGICTEGIDAATLLDKGTYGIGTCSDLDGEITVMNSRAYHFPSTATATVRRLSPTDTIPFAMLTTFQPTNTVPLPTTTTSEKVTLKTLSELLTPILDTNKNTFLSLRLTTTFAWLTTRIIPRRRSPEETLADCASRQKVTNHGRSRGTLFGFWSPAYTVGIGVPGFHLHFLSEDGENGGHVLDFEVAVEHDEDSEGEGEGRGLEVAVLREVRVELPDTEEFGRVDVEAPTAEMVRGAEGGQPLSFCIHMYGVVILDLIVMGGNWEQKGKNKNYLASIKSVRETTFYFQNAFFT
ncbi:hypothetical protein BO99DRAFT_470938 [Aspergillus violaceofuscus CBS 115571]|uniref:Alpha-acetolactate decarboxylase n=1 Tax=Aspergillus violaceofuscus (strain CBS 115571) TaxID=1450538 RepID=A0A2V5HFM0_ASPV1|nr:hypothetical protein BO99DRAFT_470938 [Aspergillus violaceofuscus CBS 115571]